MKLTNIGSSRASLKIWEVLCILAGCRDLEFEEQRKRSVLTVFTVLGIAVAIPFTIFRFSLGDGLRATLLLCVGCLQLAILIVIRFCKRATLLCRLYVILIGIYFLNLIVIGGSYGSRILWVMVYPLLALFLLGTLEGLLWSALFLLGNLLLFFYPASLLGTYAYAPEIKTRFIISYALIVLMSYIVEASRQRYQDGIQDYAAFLAVLAAIRGVGQERTEEHFWQEYLSSLVEKFRFLGAWYGAFSEGRVVPRYSSGRVCGNLHDLVLETDAPGGALHPVSRAVIDGRASGYPDIARDHDFHRWRGEALRAGFRSNLALPLEVSGHIEGAVMICAGNKAAFQRDRVERLSILNREVGNTLKERRVAKQSEEALQVAYGELEKRISERTADLRRTNRELAKENTVRKQAETALRESEQRFRELAELLPETIFEMDNRGLLTFVNQAAYNHFGYTQEDFGKGLRGADMLIPEERQRAAGTIANILKGREGVLNEYTAERKDGSTFPVLIRSTPVIREGKPVGVRGIIIDISEKKQLELRILQAQKMEAIGTLAGGIAHDFNNILMGIQACTSFILMDGGPARAHAEQLTGIEEYVMSAAELTKQLLGLAKGGKYDVKPANLNELLKKTAEMFGRTRKEIRVHLDCDEQLRVVEIDRSQIEQAILNILVNAWQAMPGGGNVYLRTENAVLDQSASEPHDLRPGEYVKLSIRDTGVGMDDETRQRVFDPFFTTKGMGRGTGLGLASAYGIIKNHSGFIDVSSRKGEGATFSLYLPAAAAGIERQEPEVIDKTIRKGQETILLVDDEKMILDVAKLLMERLGYKVTVARSGREALEILGQNREIDLVVLDLIMPEMSGAETFERLKEIAPDLKVLLASGYSINGRAEELLAKGCDGFIQKPFSVHEISQKLRSILGSE